jgi:hypothetical protein
MVKFLTPINQTILRHFQENTIVLRVFGQSELAPPVCAEMSSELVNNVKYEVLLQATLPKVPTLVF